ncbi:ANR family transcriptional regulator [Escherichia coli]|uniref:ANR family transcriptional regulator n=1 Tax=Escherichia coli TaxID=562 RepID=UPI0010CB0255|nr:ANR family transcriptional regulator [Escherichia coli]
MNGFRKCSRSSQVWRYRRVGKRAVRLEVRERWAEAADVWGLAAHIAPRTDWQQFASQRAEHCQRRSRGKDGHEPCPSGSRGCPAKTKEHTCQVG